MKRNRWIYVPLFCGASYAVMTLFFGLMTGFPVSAEMLLTSLIAFAIFGFIMLFLSDRRAKNISDGRDIRALDVEQHRNLTLLLDYRKSFDLSREAVASLNRSKILAENDESGKISARAWGNWNTSAQKIEIKLTRIGENLTEAELIVRPRLRTIMVSNGESWKIAEEIIVCLKEKDAELNKKVLAQSIGIMHEVYAESFQKEKIEKWYLARKTN